MVSGTTVRGATAISARPRAPAMLHVFRIPKLGALLPSAVMVVFGVGTTGE